MIDMFFFAVSDVIDLVSDNSGVVKRAKRKAAVEPLGKKKQPKLLFGPGSTTTAAITVARPPPSSQGQRVGSPEVQ